MAELTEKNYSEILFDLLNLLNNFMEEGSQESLYAVQEKFKAISSNESEDLAVGQIYTAVPLSEVEVQKIQESLSAKLNKKLKLTNEIDTSIVGGVKVQIGDKLYDSSVKSQLDRISESLLTSTEKTEEVKNV